MRTSKPSAAFLAALLLAVTPVMAAQLTGTAYTETFEVARYTILTINTTPEQRLILQNGTYDLAVPKGTYLLRATYRVGSRLYEDELTVRAVDDNTYAYDLLLFRAQGNGSEEELPAIDDLEIPDASTATPSILKPTLLILLLAVLVGLALALSRTRWWERKKAATVTKEKTPGPASTPSLPADLAAVLDLIRKEGGRTTQKELRRHLPLSEAKISMMLTDLESRGLVKRIKQGRSNVVSLR